MLLHFTDLYAFYLNQDIYQITSVVMKWKCFLDDKIISEDTWLYLVMSLIVNKVINPTLKPKIAGFLMLLGGMESSFF